MQLASASMDGTIKVWDARSEPEARAFDKGDSVAFSPDGNWLASAAPDATVKLWDTTTGQAIRTWAVDGQPSEETAVAFSPDGKWLASASEDRTVNLWNLADGQQLRTFERHSRRARRVAFSPDGKWLASSSGTGVAIWEVATGQGLRTFTGHTDFVRGIAFSRDGTRLASASRDQIVRLWDVLTGRLIHTFRGGYYQTKLAFSPDGTGLAIIATDRAIELWDIRTFQLIRRFEGNTAVTRGLAFTPDGKRLASTSIDGRVKLWDVATGREALLLPGRNRGARDVAFSHDGIQLATGDAEAKLWDARPWTPDAAIEREAVGLLDSLFAKPLRKADVVDYLKNSPTIRPRARQLAALARGPLQRRDQPRDVSPGELGSRPPALPQCLPVSFLPTPGRARLPPGSRSTGVSHHPRSGSLPRRPIPGGDPDPGGSRSKRQRFPGGPDIPGHGPSPARPARVRPGMSSLACGRSSTNLAGRRTLSPSSSMHEAEAIIAPQAATTER